MSIRDIAKHEFESLVMNSDDFTVVDFWAPWCKPCVALGATLTEVNIRYKGTLKIYKMNVDDEQEVAKALGVTSIPFVAMFYKGKMFNKVIGAASEQAIIGAIEQAKKAAGVK